MSGLGYESDDSYQIRHMTDGTETLVQIVYRDPNNYVGGPRIIAFGISKRRKGEPRNGHYGSALAFQRAHEMAAEYYREAADVALNGTLSTQMLETETKVLAQARKALAKQRKDVRRRSAREGYLKNFGRRFFQNRGK